VTTVLHNIVLKFESSETWLFYLGVARQNIRKAWRNANFSAESLSLKCHFPIFLLKAGLLLSDTKPGERLECWKLDFLISRSS
jgi:hypothetical protein